MIMIRVMSEADVKFATELTDIENWGHLKEDFKRLIQFDPTGCFVAWKKDERIGVVTTTSYGSYAFLGNLIVRKKDRGKGIGERLMQHAIEYIFNKGINTIELDGVFPAASLYRRLGFKDKYLSLRFMREAEYNNKEVTLPTCPESPQILINFDRAKTGIDRGSIIKRFLKEFADVTYCLRKNHVLGYAIIRPRANGYLAIGPLVAENRISCDELLSSMIKRFRGKILAIGVPEMNQGAIEIVLKHGFKYSPPSLRMYLGQRIDYERHIYGILSPDMG